MQSMIDWFEQAKEKANETLTIEAARVHWQACKAAGRQWRAWPEAGTEQ